jgi:hypothetical protein
MHQRLAWAMLWYLQFCLALEPQVDCVSTDVEQITGFVFSETIEFDSLRSFLVEVVTIEFTHDRSPKNSYLSRSAFYQDWQQL